MSSQSVPEIDPYRPSAGLAGTHLQSVLTSAPWRRLRIGRRASAFLDRSRREILSTPHGVRLLASRAWTGAEPSRGLVILLHGWEGSMDSNYLLSCASHLDRAGFDTVRINFRDHGDSHHLNPGLFHSCRLREVLDGVAAAGRSHSRGPVYLVGFSLGGNFALRIARHAPANGLELERVIAVSPVIRPRHVLDALQGGLFIYHQYFVRKWRRSLRQKQLLYPERYDFSHWFRLRDLRAQTDYLVEHHTDFPNLEAYLEGYSVAGDYLEGLEVPTRIITSVDDPIIPVNDFHQLPRPPALEIDLLERGGHCGFLENWRLDSWIDRRIQRELCLNTTRS